MAKRLKDPILECKCWLYFAEDLIQLGKLKKAKKIIFNQVGFIDLIQDSIVSNEEKVLGVIYTICKLTKCMKKYS